MKGLEVFVTCSMWHTQTVALLQQSMLVYIPGLWHTRYFMPMTDSWQSRDLQSYLQNHM